MPGHASRNASVTTRGRAVVAILALTLAIAGIGIATAANPLTKVTVSLSPGIVPANGAAQSWATVTVKNALNQPKANTPVYLATNGDVTFSSSSGTTDTAGHFISLITASTTPGIETISASSGGTTATASLTEHGPATSVQLTLDPSTIPPDATSTSIATAIVRDALGSPVVNEQVGFRTSGDVTFGPVTNNGGGSYTSVVRASVTLGSETITATANQAGVSGTAVLTEAFSPLHTSGNKIYDVANNQVIFRGINAGFLTLQPGENPILTKDSVDHIKGWKANLVRVFLNDAFWLNPACYPTNYQQTVDQYVQWITSDGMIALLTLGTGNVDGSLGCTPPELPAMADAAHALTFWSQVANRYKNNAHVAFDLYNEPWLTLAGAVAPGEDGYTVWRNGGHATDGHGGYYPVAGMQQMYDTVRATGATNLVIVSGAGPDTNDQGTPGGYDIAAAATLPVTGSNIVYSVHPYYMGGCGRVELNATTATATTDPPPGSGLPKNLGTMIKKVSGTYPVMFAEFGSVCWNGNALKKTGAKPDGQIYMNNVVTWAEARGIGWAGFAWDRLFPGGWGVIDNWSTYTPSPFGLPLYNTMQAH
jgi:endoglucanase